MCVCVCACVYVCVCVCACVRQLLLDSNFDVQPVSCQCILSHGVPYIHHYHNRKKLNTKTTHDDCATSLKYKILANNPTCAQILGRINPHRVPMSKWRHVPQTAVLARLSAALSVGCLCPGDSDAILCGRLVLPVMVRNIRKPSLQTRDGEASDRLQSMGDCELLAACGLSAWPRVSLR